MVGNAYDGAYSIGDIGAAYGDDDLCSTGDGSSDSCSADAYCAGVDAYKDESRFG